MIPGGMSDLTIPEYDPPPAFHASCPECGRLFNLLNEDDAAELAYGHDCEA